MNKYNVGDVFTNDDEYSARAEFCNENGFYISEMESLNGERRFQICAIEHDEEVERAEQELTTTENRINEIKEELLTATLLDDTETIDALKAEYKELLNEEV